MLKRSRRQQPVHGGDRDTEVCCHLLHRKCAIERHPLLSCCHFVHRSSSSLEDVSLTRKPPKALGLDIFESGCDREPQLNGIGLHAKTLRSPGARAPATQVLPWFEHRARRWSNFSIRNSRKWNESGLPNPGVERIARPTEARIWQLKLREVLTDQDFKRGRHLVQLGDR